VKEEGEVKKSKRKRNAGRSLNGGGLEHCMNPWNGDCRNTDIQLYIFFRQRRRPICRACWEGVAKGDYSWNSLNKGK